MTAVQRTHKEPPAPAVVVPFPDAYRGGRGNASRKVKQTSAGPWETWKRMSRPARAIKFIETYLRPVKGYGYGQPIKLAKFEKEFFEEALADGSSAYAESIPRGNGKSTKLAGLAAWGVFDDNETGQPSVPVVAVTVGQAIRGVFGLARDMILGSPELADRCLNYTGVATSRVWVYRNNGELFPVAAEQAGIQGLDPSLAIADEMGFLDLDAWNGLLMAAGKRERSLTVGIGTPGVDRDNAMWSLRSAVHEGVAIPGFHFREYAADMGCRIDDRRQWRKANPAIAAGFLSIAALERDLKLTPEGHFRIFRLGQWYEGTDCWLGPNGRVMWDALEASFAFVDGAPTWVGVDVGLKRDSTAVVAVQADAAGGLHTMARFWLPTADEPVDATDVMQHIRDLGHAYSLQAVSFDPRFFDVPAKMLSDEGIPLVEIPQSVEQMTRACGGLLEHIKAGKVHHDGHATLRAHVMNAMPRFNEHGFTLQKGKSRGRIDGCIALALAVDRYERGVTTATPNLFLF